MNKKRVIPPYPSTLPAPKMKSCGEWTIRSERSFEVNSIIKSITYHIVYVNDS